MENIANKLIKSSQKNLAESFIAHLYKSKGYSIGKALQLDECEVLGTNLITKKTTKTQIKEYVMANSDVILYLDVNLEEIESTKIIKYSSLTTEKLIPFVCIGWSDYEYVTSVSVEGKKMKNRGFFILQPITSNIEEENFYYLPYKFFKSEETNGETLIREVWCFDNIAKVVIPTRPRIEMRIAERIFKDSGVYYETDGFPCYSANGNPLVPLRTIATRFGYNVSWNKRKKLITLTKPDTSITVHVGDKHCIKNGKTVLFGVPVEINVSNKRSYVSLGFIKAVFNCDGEFVKEGELIKIFRNT